MTGVGGASPGPAPLPVEVPSRGPSGWVALGLLAAALVALVGIALAGPSGDRPGSQAAAVATPVATPTATPVATPTGTPVTASSPTAPSAPAPGTPPPRVAISVDPVYECPPGSTPDEPGPVDQARPPSSIATIAFDRAFGRIVLVGPREGRVSAETWTFDVCTNTWAEMHPASEPDFGFMAMLAYDTAARRSILTSNTGGVWAYDLAADTWTRLTSGTWTRPNVTGLGGVRLAYDSRAARLVGLRVDPPHRMWSLASGADVWEPVDQVVWPLGSDAQPLFTYDASVDRLVGYGFGAVHLFDLLTGTWSSPEATPPAFGYGGWFSLGGEIAYDEAALRTVLFSNGHVIAYDAAADRWETLYGKYYAFPDECGIHPECRSQPSMVYDPVNQRLVVYGGNVHATPAGYYPSDDVLAFDTGTREWAVLLEASALEPTP